ncbi:hypothetical protein MIR68_011822 [Amoeboaphelidium protococcarum]|nr:hypothetical protein MIR68_011822 [Amoeboaphelidium protococcarum]
MPAKRAAKKDRKQKGPMKSKAKDVQQVAAEREIKAIPDLPALPEPQAESSQQSSSRQNFPGADVVVFAEPSQSCISSAPITVSFASATAFLPRSSDAVIFHQVVDHDDAPIDDVSSESSDIGRIDDMADQDFPVINTQLPNAQMVYGDNVSKTLNPLQSFPGQDWDVGMRALGDQESDVILLQYKAFATSLDLKLPPKFLEYLKHLMMLPPMIDSHENSEISNDRKPPVLLQSKMRIPPGIITLSFVVGRRFSCKTPSAFPAGFRAHHFSWCTVTAY